MKKLVVLAVAASLLGGCASSVKRIDLVDGQQIQSANYRTEKGINKVTLELNSVAKEKLVENLKFNPDQLRSIIVRGLEARNVIRSEGDYTVDVVITDIRVRSSFAAVAFGFMAGADSVKGTVTVHDQNHNPVKSFEVEASYALGGIGGLDDSRMNWLYEKFSEKTLKELSPRNDKTASAEIK